MQEEEEGLLLIGNFPLLRLETELEIFNFPSDGVVSLPAPLATSSTITHE